MTVFDPFVWFIGLLALITVALIPFVAVAWWRNLAIDNEPDVLDGMFEVLE